MKANLLFSQFLTHFENCGGCIGYRKIQNCKYARPCESAEALGKKGIRNAKELLVYGVKTSDKHSSRDGQCFAVDME